MKSCLLALALILQFFTFTDAHAYTVRDAGNGRIEIFCGNRQPPSIADNYPSGQTNMHQVTVWARANCKEGLVGNPVLGGGNGGAPSTVQKKANINK
jgi:hypothetical protein